MFSNFKKKNRHLLDVRCRVWSHLSICWGAGALCVSITSQLRPVIHMLTSSSLNAAQVQGGHGRGQRSVTRWKEMLPWFTVSDSEDSDSSFTHTEKIPGNQTHNLLPANQCTTVCRSSIKWEFLKQFWIVWTLWLSNGSEWKCVIVSHTRGGFNWAVGRDTANTNQGQRSQLRRRLREATAPRWEHWPARLSVFRRNSRP